MPRHNIDKDYLRFFLKSLGLLSCHRVHMKCIKLVCTTLDLNSDISFFFLCTAMFFQSILNSTGCCYPGRITLHPRNAQDFSQSNDAQKQDATNYTIRVSSLLI